MKYLLSICIVVAFAVIPAFAQTLVSIEVGAFGGVPLNHTLQSEFCCTTAAAFFGYATEDASYITGLSAGVVLWDRVHVAFGALGISIAWRLPLAEWSGAPVFGRRTRGSQPNLGKTR